MFIGVGGCVGAILRYMVSGLPIGAWTGLPINTLLINSTGCIFLGFFLTAARNSSLPVSVQAGIATGLLGAFTTFSTLCGQCVRLIDQGAWDVAALYIALSTVLGVLAVYAGHTLANKALGNRGVTDAPADGAILEESEGRS